MGVCSVMNVRVFDSKVELGKAAAVDAARLIQQTIAARDWAYVIAATGASQFEFLDALVKQEVDWKRVVFFHLDEYVGIPETHPASFRCYLRDRIINRVNPRTFNFINGEARNVQEECAHLGELISRQTIDVAFVGIGENGHLAFNDPPADFETEEPYLVVELDRACRQQQVGEGWFSALDEVPTQAISMSIRQILKARHILCIVPDQRKAEAVKASIESEVSPLTPASILQKHDSVTLYLDHASSSLLRLLH